MLVSTNRPSPQRRPQAGGQERSGSQAQGKAQRQSRPSQARGQRRGPQARRGAQGFRPQPGDTFYTPGASRTRQNVEQRSAAPLLFLRQLPPWLLPLVLVVLLIVGLAVGGLGGGIALVGVALVLAWLGALSWPKLSPAGRAGRALVIALVLVAAVVEAVR